MTLKAKIIHRLILTVVAAIMLFMLFIIGRNMLHALSIGADMSTLNAEAKLYKSNIKRDSTLLEELKYDDKLEKFAREKYRMQRRGESVYVVE